MNRMIRVGLALWLAAQAASAFAVTGFKYISTSGDYIGGGQTQTFETPDATISASGTGGHVSVSVTDPDNWWTIEFASPVDSRLRRGSYPDAARYPFNSPMGPGLSMYGNGRGCNELKGWFRVREYELDNNGQVMRLAIDFVQNCEVTGPPLYGAVRINSDLPLKVPNTVAVAGADSYALEGEKVTLDGRQSFSRRAAPIGYQWTQTDGPAVVLDNPKSMLPVFTAPAVAVEGATLHFRLDVTDASGHSAKDDVVVLVESQLAPRTEVSFHGDAGDYITGGRSYRYNLHNATIGFSRNFDNGVSASISGDTWWYFDAAAPEGKPFAPGKYRNATRFPFQDPNSPGLSLFGDGRGCNTLEGKFVVYDVKFDESGAPEKLDMSFEQHCEGGAPAAKGRLLLNAVPHEKLAARFRAARLRYGDRP